MKTANKSNRKLEDFESIDFQGKAIVTQELDEVLGTTCLHTFWTWGIIFGQTMYFLAKDVENITDEKLRDAIQLYLKGNKGFNLITIIREENYVSASFNQDDLEDQIISNSFKASKTSK